MKRGTLVAYAGKPDTVAVRRANGDFVLDITPKLVTARVASAEYHQGFAEADPYYTLWLDNGARVPSFDVVEVKE